MIFDFPTIKSKTVTIEEGPHYIQRKSVITRKPWLRIIWMATQKTILIGRHRISVTSEPDSTAHMQQVNASEQEWWEK